MKKNNKKALYESIMKNVSKLLKKTLNESEDVEGYMYDALTKLDELGDSENAGYIKEDILLIINNLAAIAQPLLSYDYDEDSLEEEAVIKFDKTINRLKNLL